ncbi:MAG: DUF4345 domain-containing protein [Pseudomonadota bacterium]
MTTTAHENEKQTVSRVILGVSGFIAVAISVTILFAPGAFYTGYGIDVVGNPTLANELKAPSGALLMAGLLMLAGVVRLDWLAPALATATLVYLSYGFGRVLSIGLDGMPHSGMVAAAVIELLIGAICLVALQRLSQAPITRPVRNESLTAHR